MNKLLGIFLMGVFFILTAKMPTLFMKKNTQHISNIKSFEFSYSQGVMMNSNVRYSIEKENDKYIAKIKPLYVAEEEAKVVEVTEEIIKEIETVLDEYNVEKWDGFDKSDKYVLDGDTFSMSICMENGDKINASGYMKWPENYVEVRSRLDSIFEKI